MKIVFPIEMKIRTVVNVLGYILAGLDVAFSIWLAVVIFEATTEVAVVIPAIFSLIAGGLYFLMAKLMWSLSKSKKAFGKILLVIIGALGIIADIMLLNAPDNEEVLTPIILDLIFICGSLANTIIGYMVEAKLIKMKYLVYS